MEPCLHNYFFSMETLLVLFFYKTAGVIFTIISLSEHLPRKWRHEFNAFLRDIWICFFFLCGESILITKAQVACSRGANPLAKPMIICRMKRRIVQSEKSNGKENLPVSQWLGHSGGHDSGGLIFVSRIACLPLWKKYIGNPGSEELESRMGFCFTCFVISFLLLSSQIFNHPMQNYLKQGTLK